MLKTNFLGIELNNPLIVAAGPWNMDGANLHDSIAAGAGAVVTESIVSDTMIDVGPRIACDENGAQTGGRNEEHAPAEAGQAGKSSAAGREIPCSEYAIRVDDLITGDTPEQD